jgi:hypothetical protein
MLLISPFSWIEIGGSLRSQSHSAKAQQHIMGQFKQPKVKISSPLSVFLEKPRCRSVIVKIVEVGGQKRLFNRFRLDI